jgi:hypothetical protein
VIAVAGVTRFRLALALAALALAAAVAAADGRAWGGQFTASTGEPVNLTFSDSYPQDPARAQYWADYVAGLVHGAELASVRIHLAPLPEVQRRCGFGAAACYSPFSGLMIVPGEGLSDGSSAESIVAHEYGHHVAQNRTNPPWEAVDWGTKRWSSHVNVCAQADAGMLFPGDEGREYRLNPGEGFAEAYRLLNDRRGGRPDLWNVVENMFFPNATALLLLEQDVLEPWTANQSVRFSGSFRGAGPATRGFSVATPLDGTLRITLKPPAKANLSLALFSGKRLIGRAPAGSRTISTTICGQRSFTVRVGRTRGVGAFSLQVSKP